MFHIKTAAKAALLTLLATTALPSGTAHGASYLDNNYHLRKGENTSYFASLAEITQGDIHRTRRTLDWRQPSLDLFFDLPPTERTKDITLNLSATPIGRVPRNAPIQVQFNNEKPVPINSGGHSFEASITLNTSRARQTRNKLRIIFPTPRGEECVTPAHGQWSVDLAGSSLSIKGRKKTGYTSFSELTARLEQPALSPKRVGLIAEGPLATDMQALAAQGIALRTPSIPKFSVSNRNTDFTILMVTRDNLYKYTDDAMILDSKGARAFIPRGQSNRLIFTANSSEEILETLKVFSTHEFPKTRRPITSLEEIDLQYRLDIDRVFAEKKTKLSDLARANRITTFSEDAWASGIKSYHFDVEDPAATKAEVLLRLSSSENLSENSRLRVALNGDILGAAKLDKPRKSVVFDIPSGKLNASSNILSLLPELAPKDGFSCTAPDETFPNFRLGSGSKLILKSSAPSHVSELSRLASTGSVFAEQESYIALPRNTTDFEASLQVLGRLAKSAGGGLVEADYTRRNEISDDRHLLIIGPAKFQNAILEQRTRTPISLKRALQGETISGNNLLSSGIENFASAGADDFAVQYAAANIGPRQLSQGGVAALYAGGHNNMVGVISSSPRAHFPTAMSRLIENDHWNALRGSVSRWDKKSVIMAQTAQPISGIDLPLKSKDKTFFGIDVPDVTLPDFQLPEFKKPDWEIPQVKFPEFKWSKAKPVLPVIKPAKTSQFALREAPVQTILIEAPDTTYEGVISADTFVSDKPKLKNTKPSNGLRKRFSLETLSFPRIELPVIKTPEIGSFETLQDGTKSKWVAFKRWTKTKFQSVKSSQSLKNAERKISKFQRSLGSKSNKTGKSILDKLPGQGVVKFADKTFSVFGILLILTFLLVVILMSFASPSSRLGGRH